MFAKIKNHFITRKKYNSLEIKYLSLREEVANLVTELQTQKKINEIERKKFKENVEELAKEISKKRKEQ